MKSSSRSLGTSVGFLFVDSVVGKEASGTSPVGVFGVDRTGSSLNSVSKAPSLRSLCAHAEHDFSSSSGAVFSKEDHLPWAAFLWPCPR